MKINPLFIIVSIVIIVFQKLIFSDPVMILSEELPIMVFIVPVIILALPNDIERPITMIIAFFLGLIIDVLHDTLGMTSFALVMLAYFRPTLMRLIQPRKGYQGNTSWMSYGFSWVILYVLSNMLVFAFTYFMVDAFTFVFVKKVLLNTLLATLVSTPFCILFLSLLKYR